MQYDFVNIVFYNIFCEFCILKSHIAVKPVAPQVLARFMDDDSAQEQQ